MHDRDFSQSWCFNRLMGFMPNASFEGFNEMNDLTCQGLQLFQIRVSNDMMNGNLKDSFQDLVQVEGHLCQID